MSVLHGILNINVLVENFIKNLNEYIIISNGNVMIQCPHIQHMLNDKVYFMYHFSVTINIK